ncbi:CLUMA_CG016834, isoform A [Clunio marinus]|uniref:CLUMA_CG016834, isoform A n=1 Tax=Clunio marinus TaxID=568069 RepID=A0A1J1IV50_9DIPT|nr:CLUMA_CG016834, isoform A [Clunio marinus]
MYPNFPLGVELRHFINIKNDVMMASSSHMYLNETLQMDDDKNMCRTALTSNKYFSCSHSVWIVRSQRRDNGDKKKVSYNSYTSFEGDDDEEGVILGFLICMQGSFIFIYVMPDGMLLRQTTVISHLKY